MLIYCIICWTLNALIVIFFLALAFKSNLLRDGIDNPVAFTGKAAIIPKFVGRPFEDIPKPFSLSRTQLGVWTVIIGCSYTYLMICKGCVVSDVIGQSKTALLLLGISAATTGLASIIDQSQSASNQSPNQPPRHQDQPSQGFLTDILSDNNGISIHRFQNVVWTVIAMVIYLIAFSNSSDCKLPELDATLLTLTGISNATYLGLKVKENAKN